MRVAQLMAVHEVEAAALVAERDRWEEKATRLASYVGGTHGQDFGEHSSGNNPVDNALAFLE